MPTHDYLGSRLTFTADVVFNNTLIAALSSFSLLVFFPPDGLGLGPSGFRKCSMWVRSLRIVSTTARFNSSFFSAVPNASILSTSVSRASYLSTNFCWFSTVRDAISAGISAIFRGATAKIPLAHTLISFNRRSSRSRFSFLHVSFLCSLACELKFRMAIKAKKAIMIGAAHVLKTIKISPASKQPCLLDISNTIRTTIQRRATIRYDHSKCFLIHTIVFDQRSLTKYFIL